MQLTGWDNPEWIVCVAQSDKDIRHAILISCTYFLLHFKDLGHTIFKLSTRVMIFHNVDTQNLFDCPTVNYHPYIVVLLLVVTCNHFQSFMVTW